MASIDLANLGTTIMRSNGSAGQSLYNTAGRTLIAKGDALAVDAGGADHYRLLPGPPPVAPGLPPLSPTCTHDMVNDTTIAGVSALKTSYSAGADTVFLPFQANVISSAVLDGSGAGAVDYFFTAELSGCSIFIDKDPVSQRVIVYHANGLGRCATAQQIQNDWHMEWLTTPHTNYMVNLYNEAHNRYLPSCPGLVQQGVLSKAQYGATIQAEIARKVHMNRSKVNLLWGTNVFGERVGNTWNFYYQVFGGLEEYERPITAPKRWKETAALVHAGASAGDAWKRGREVRGRGTVDVWDHALFCSC
jgi:hypothetical protein